MSLVINSGGLGATDPLTPVVPNTQTTTLSPGTISMCNSWAYYVTIPCWQLSRDAWAEAASLPPVPSNLVAAPGAPANLTTVPDTTGAASQALSNAAISQTQANIQGFVSSEDVPENPLGTDACESFTQNWPSPFDGMTCTTMMVWGAVGLAIALVLPRLLK